MKLLTIKEAAEIASVSERTMQRHIESGELPFVNLGTSRHKTKRIDQDDLREFLNARKESAKKLRTKNRMAGVTQFYR